MAPVDQKYVDWEWIGFCHFEQQLTSDKNTFFKLHPSTNQSGHIKNILGEESDSYYDNIFGNNASAAIVDEGNDKAEFEELNQVSTIQLVVSLFWLLVSVTGSDGASHVCASIMTSGVT